MRWILVIAAHFGVHFEQDFSELCLVHAAKLVVEMDPLLVVVQLVPCQVPIHADPLLVRILDVTHSKEQFQPFEHFVADCRILAMGPESILKQVDNRPRAVTRHLFCRTTPEPAFAPYAPLSVADQVRFELHPFLLVLDVQMRHDLRVPSHRCKLVVHFLEVPIGRNVPSILIFELLVPHFGGLYVRGHVRETHLHDIPARRPFGFCHAL